MASGKRSSLLSSLADYGDDSEPDSDIEDEDTGECHFIQTCVWFMIIRRVQIPAVNRAVVTSASFV